MSIAPASSGPRAFAPLVVVAAVLAAAAPTSAQATPSAWHFQEVLPLGAGIPAPAPAGQTLVEFHLGDVDENGTIHFVARIEGTPLRYGLYRFEDGEVRATRVPGDTAPSPVGGVYGDVSRDVDYARNGLVAFIGEVTGGAAASGLFTWAEGNDTSGPFEGQPAPGTNGGVFSHFLEVELDASGTLAFIALVSGGTSSSGVFRVAPGGPVEAVALQGQPAPVGGPYQEFYFLALSDSGDLAFAATDGFELQGTRVVRVSGGVHTVVAVAGEPAPDLPGHTYYHEGTLYEFPNFGTVALGAAGELAFTAALDDCRIWLPFGLFVPVVCAVFQQTDGAVHHVLGQNDDGVGHPDAIDIESGIGTLIETSSPSRVQLYDGLALTDVLLDPDVDPDVTWSLDVVSARIGPGGLIAAHARPHGSGAGFSIWRGEPVVGVPLLGPWGVIALAAALGVGGLVRWGRAPSRRA